MHGFFIVELNEKAKHRRDCDGVFFLVHLQGFSVCADAHSSYRLRSANVSFSFHENEGFFIIKYVLKRKTE
jgi:hypothetical protein